MRRYLRLLAAICCILCQLLSVDGFFKYLLQIPVSISQQRQLWRENADNLFNKATSFGGMNLTFLRSFQVPTPSYVQVLTEGVLSITSFSLLRKGSIVQLDLSNSSTSLGITPVASSLTSLFGDYLWPNELANFNDCFGNSVLLIPDGFLLPGQNDGALYAIYNPPSPGQAAIDLRTSGNSEADALKRQQQPVRITRRKPGWFYHRAKYVNLPNGPRVDTSVSDRSSVDIGDYASASSSSYCGILTARALKPLFGPGKGELVWIDMRNGPVGPWPETILVEGPDVMFEVLDLDDTDDCLEIVSAHFFGEKLSVHSIRATPESPYIEISQTQTLDTIGKPYGLCLASMYGDEAATNIVNDDDISSGETYSSSGSWFPEREVIIPVPNSATFTSRAPPLLVDVSELKVDDRRTDRGNEAVKGKENILEAEAPATHLIVTTHECSYDLWSAVSMGMAALKGKFPIIKQGRDSASLLMGEEVGVVKGSRGGMLFAYELPRRRNKVGKSNGRNGSEHTREWSLKSTDAAGTHTNAIVSADSSAEEGAASGTYDDTDIDNLNSTVVSSSTSSSNTVSGTLNWTRHTLFRGFRVRGWGGIFSPGAPGFPYAFRFPNRPKTSPPLILLAGDCTGSAYIFSPAIPAATSKQEVRCGDGDVHIEVTTAGAAAVTETKARSESPAFPLYELAFEVECGATVGSAAVAAAADGSSDIDIFIPSYELNKVHVFRLSDKAGGQAILTYDKNRITPTEETDNDSSSPPGAGTVETATRQPELVLPGRNADAKVVDRAPQKRDVAQDVVCSHIPR